MAGENPRVTRSPQCKDPTRALSVPPEYAAEGWTLKPASRESRPQDHSQHVIPLAHNFLRAVSMDESRRSLERGCSGSSFTLRAPPPRAHSLPLFCWWHGSSSRAGTPRAQHVVVIEREPDIPDQGDGRFQVLQHQGRHAAFQVTTRQRPIR